jgi:hypothetical protein
MVPEPQRLSRPLLLSFCSGGRGHRATSQRVRRRACRAAAVTDAPAGALSPRHLPQAGASEDVRQRPQAAAEEEEEEDEGVRHSAEFPWFEIRNVLSTPLGYVACVSAITYTDVGRRYRTGASRPVRRSRGDLLARSTRGRVSARRALPAPAPPRPATHRIFHIRFRTILKIEYVARVFTFTRSLIDSDCVLLRNTRWGTAIAIG